VAESCTICSSRSRRPVRKLFGYTLVYWNLFFVSSLVMGRAVYNSVLMLHFRRHLNTVMCYLFYTKHDVALRKYDTLYLILHGMDVINSWHFYHSCTDFTSSVILHTHTHTRGPSAKVADSPYDSDSELCGGAVTVSFSKYLPWQAIHFLQCSTHFSKTEFCKNSF
jgi:hypothetical protein